MPSAWEGRILSSKIVENVLGSSIIQLRLDDVITLKYKFKYILKILPQNEKYAWKHIATRLMRVNQ